MMAFTDTEKTDIRRFMGYGVYGAQATQGFAYRFFQREGTLEYRMNNLSPAEEAVVRTTFLATLYGLETGIPAAAANLDTDSAAVWKHNPDEVRDRERLFDGWRRRLCRFFRLPPGPELASGGGIGLVV